MESGVFMEFDHRETVSDLISPYAEINPGKCEAVTPIVFDGSEYGWEEQGCIPEISRHYSGAAKFSHKSAYAKSHPAFLALKAEVHCANCLIRGFRPILGGGEVMVPFQWDTLAGVLHTTEQAAL